MRWALGAGLALTLGALCAESYARLAAPYYAAVARLIAIGHPWQIVSVNVGPGKSSPGAELRMIGEVRRHRADPESAATVVSRVQVGDAVETPVVFWGLVLLWPARTFRQRWTVLATGLPVFLALEAVTTAWQLVYPMADASAMIAGNNDPLTLGDCWSRILEAGGRFVLVIGAALLTVSRRSHP